MLVRINEPMRVAPGGHVIDLKAGEEASGSLAQYLVTTGCDVTVVEEDAAPAGPDTGDGGLSASLTAATDVTDTPIIEPEPAKAPAVKPVKSGKAAAK